MRRICIVVLAIFLFACEEESPKSVDNAEEVKVVKKEKYKRLDDILFIDNEYNLENELHKKLLVEFKFDLQKVKIDTFYIQNEILFLDIIMYDSGNLIRKCLTKQEYDTLNIEFGLTYPKFPPTEAYISKYQIRLPLNKYKFKYLAFPKSKIVKSLKELSSQNN